MDCGSPLPLLSTVQRHRPPKMDGVARPGVGCDGNRPLYAAPAVHIVRQDSRFFRGVVVRSVQRDGRNRSLPGRPRLGPALSVAAAGAEIESLGRYGRDGDVFCVFRGDSRLVLAPPRLATTRQGWRAALCECRLTTPHTHVGVVGATVREYR